MGNSETRVAVTILLFVICSWSVPAQENIQFRVACWNTENLFDTRHDSLKNDYEFLPNAIRHWNYNRYKKKLSDIARVITAIGEWNPPALIGLCEVENDTVLRDLTRRSPLQELDYRYVMTDSPDLRGIDVALIYQRDFIQTLILPLYFHSCVQATSPDKKFAARQRSAADRRYIGCISSAIFQAAQAEQKNPSLIDSMPLKFYAQKVDSVLHTRLHPQVIIMGDFNDYPNNKSIRKILEAEAPPIRSDSLDIAIHPATSPPSLSPLKLYHLLARKAKTANFGSYKYHGEWGLLDHLIVSGTLLNTSGNFFTREEKAKVCQLPFLLTDDKKYGGKRTFSHL